MPTIYFRANILLALGETDFPPNGQLTEKAYEIQPAENLNLGNYTAASTFFYSIPAATVDKAIPFGMVNIVTLLIIHPDQPISLKIVNNNGTSQILEFAEVGHSILHLNNVSEVLASNPLAGPITGKIIFAGTN